MKQDKLLSAQIAYLLFGCLGFLFVFCLVTGYDLADRGNLLWTTGYTAKVLGVSLVAGLSVGTGICRLFYFLAQKKAKGQDWSQRTKETCRKRKRKEQCQSWKDEDDSAKRHKRWSLEQAPVWAIYLGSLLFIVIAWLPGYLAYYPAICAYDTPIQTGQIVGGQLIDHHPIAHTLLVKGAMVLGDVVFGNVNVGIGVYALVQMLFLAAVFAFGVSRLKKHGLGSIWLCVVQLLCMFYPFHLYMSVTMTKDTIFTGFFVLQVLALWELAGRNDAGREEPDQEGLDLEGQKVPKPKRDRGKRAQNGAWGMRFAFLVSTIGMMLFRNNGKYAVVVLLVFLFFAVLAGKERKRFWGGILLWTLAAFLAGSVFLSILFRVTGAQQGDRREMLSLPIQQLARTMLYHGGVGELSEDDGSMGQADKALVNDFILNEGYRSYRPDFADPVKSNTNTYVVRYRTKEFVTTYLRLFFQYPGDFVNAFLAVNAGYLYPGDVSHAWVNFSQERPGGGYVQTRWDVETLRERGIYKDSRWPWLFEVMERWADENAYLKLPVIKYLFVPGVWIWLYLLLIGWHLIQREYGRCLPHVLVLGYFGTLLLGPTVQMRYLYPVMAVFPFLAGLGSLDGRRSVS